MRIALVVYGSLDQISGGYLYDRQVVGFLRRQGVEVDVHGLKAAPYLASVLHNFSPRLRRLLREGRSGAVPYDAVVVDELVHPSVFLAVGGRQRAGSGARPPVFTLVHHLKCRESIGPLRRAAARWMERRLLRHSDRLLVNSSTTEASVRQLVPHGAPLWVCPPGCDLQERVRPKIAHEQPGGAPATLLTTGNLIPRKGHDLLLEALAGLGDLPWRLRVVGRLVDRRYVARLRRRATRSGLAERICFTGELSDIELAAEYARADLFVFPSRFEGYGIALAEALRVGLPFVAFTGGAVPEMFGSAAGAETCMGLVPEGDVPAFRQTLRRLLTDSAFRAAEAVRSRRLGAILPAWEQTGECFHRALLKGIGHG